MLKTRGFMVAMGAVLVFGCSASGTDDDDDTSPSSTPTPTTAPPTATPFPEETPTPTLRPIYNDVVCGSFYEDDDGDFFSEADGDCDDSNPQINPDVYEVCNYRDDDCNGAVDDHIKYNWWPDRDEDGYGDTYDSTYVKACTQPERYSSLGGDCDDTDPDVHPQQVDSICDGIDQDCDNGLDYNDYDLDGFLACEDCNDGDAETYPGADEICDEADNDCDGQIDEGFPYYGLLYLDRDNDHYGTEEYSIGRCSETREWDTYPNYISEFDDCDDWNRLINPEAPDICDGVDNDCDGEIDEDCAERVCPSEEEADPLMPGGDINNLTSIERIHQ